MTGIAALAWQQPPLAGLALEDTYVYYDGPKLFSCINTAGERFLCAWAQETESFDRWLCTPLSDARHRMLRGGQTPVREIFQHPEGALYILTERWETRRARYEIEQRDPLDVPESWLPAPEAIIEIENNEHPHASCATRPGER